MIDYVFTRSHNGEETVGARSGLVPMIWDKISFFRTNRDIPRGARAYCRKDFREDVARRNVNIMASKITSVSEVNIGFLLSVSIPSLRQGLLKHFFESSHESEDVSMMFSCRMRKPTALKTLYKTFHIAAIWGYKE